MIGFLETGSKKIVDGRGLFEGGFMNMTDRKSVV